MRYAKGHKETSRDRILTAAAKRFRRDGIAASGMTRIMAEAGLTNGSFYAHFESKTDLVRRGLESSLDAQLESLSGADAEQDLMVLVEGYLSRTHRDGPEEGCASAALLPEIARQPLQTRAAYTQRLRALIGQIARRLPNPSPEGEKTAMAVFAMLVGTLQLARAIDDQALSDAMLEAGIQAARAVVGSRAD